MAEPPALIEDAFTFEELELLEELTDPIKNHTRIDGPVQLEIITRLSTRISLALRRARFHKTVRSIQI